MHRDFITDIMAKVDIATGMAAIAVEFMGAGMAE
jgi:hypothetical protein